MALSLLLLLAAPCAAVSLSRSSVIAASRSGSGAGRAVVVAAPELRRPGINFEKYFRFPSGRGALRSSSSSSSPSSSSTALHHALGGGYLEDIDHPDDDGPPGGNRWGFFGGNSEKRTAQRGNNRDGGSASFGRRGTTPNEGMTNGNSPSGGGNFGIGGNRRQGGGGKGGGGNGGNNGGGGGTNPKVFSIRQPQDLLDFVIQDERLSVIKVYASWCKTCAVFDVRYRKLASQLGDTAEKKGRVRFAEMQYDDPNNEEMCKLLNATKLPYILMYKGSKGKVTDFQCGPAKFQRLLDAVEEYADPEGAPVASGADGPGWKVVREQNQRLRQAQQAAQYAGGTGSSSGDDELKRKEEEIARLYSELSNLRADFDRRVLLLKKEHTEETSELNERIRSQTEAFDNERRALAKQIEELSREMVDRERSLQSKENASAARLRGEMREKEEDYKKTVTALNLRITELEQDLFKSRNELRYKSGASSNDRQRLQEHIANLETEVARLTERNQGLERELIEEKRVVVASTEEASRVLKQLEKIKRSEDEERKALEETIVKLEAQIDQRETQLLNIANGGDLADEIQAELEQLKKEHERERQLLNARISELERELAYYSDNENNLSRQQREQQQAQRKLQEEGEALASRILELENEIDERDRLLRTSNKAADILLDNMEAQKRDYEEELERTASLVEELEKAIAGREGELEVLRERTDGLERRVAAANKWRQREEERALADAERQEQQQVGSLEQERQARIAAEREVGKLMGYLKDREEEMTVMQQQQQQQQQQQGAGGGMEAPGWFGEFGALFNGGTNAGQNMADGGFAWYEAMMNGENNEEMENYEMLNDVLERPNMPNQSGGAGRSENVWEGATGQSSFGMSPDGNAGAGRSENIWEGADGNAGAGRSENIWEGASSFGSSSQNVPSPVDVPSPAELPTPAMAFERRLAENPIVPAGAFGGSKPTASFFSSRPSGGAAAPSDTPDYYQNVISGFNDRGPSGREDAQPAMPPAESYQQRPTAPSPRTAAPRMTENIYAGAGSLGANVPTPVPREEPAVQVPTPQMEFERRIAENPIVPAGAFGGKAPTARFFTPPATGGGGGGGGGGAGTGGTYGSTGGTSNFGAARTQQEDDTDSRAKWQRLDDNEKKRVAAEAYRAFEKSLEDRRGTALKPNAGSPGREGAARTSGGAGVVKGAAAGGGGGSVANGAAKRPAATATNKKSSTQVELERKRHQEMVKAAAAAKGQAAAVKGNAGTPPAAKSAPAKKAAQPQQSTGARAQSAEQIRASAAQASAKRMSLAERAAKADQDRKQREIRLKAEARKAQEAKQMETLRRAAEAEAKLKEEGKRNEEEAKSKRNEEEAKRKEEIRRAEELKRRAEADLASAAEAKAKADAIETAKREQANDDEAAAQARQGRVEEARQGSLDPSEMIEAALLGAEEYEGDGEQSQKEWPVEKKTKVLAASRTRTVAGSGFAASTKYDVMIVKDRKRKGNADDVPPRILEGSLKDLLKGKKTPKRNAGDLNY